MFSAVHLLGMNVVWLFLIILARHGLSLLARILVLHLYIRLQQDIGLQSPFFEGFGTLGTKVMMVELELTSLSSLAVLKMDNTALVCYDLR